MDIIDLLFRGVGLFYLVGAYFGLRAILMDSVLDKALAALSAAPEDPTEKHRRYLMGALTVGFGAGGAALLMMSILALPLFLLALAAQIIWLAGARRLFVRAEDDDPQSARQVANAAVLYAAATLGVVWLWWTGRLGPWDDPLVIAATLVATLGLGGWLVYHLAWQPASSADDDFPTSSSEPESPPERIVIDPARGLWPLVDADSGQRFNHLTWLDEEIAWRIEDWDDTFQEAFDPEDEMASVPVFVSGQSKSGYEAEAGSIAELLRQTYGAANVSFGSGWPGRLDRSA